MLVFFFVILIILSIIIILLAATTIQIQINNLFIKDNQRKDGEIKLVFKLLKIIPYFEINLLDSKLLKKKVTIKNIEKSMKNTKLKLFKKDITNFLEITKIDELYLKINLQSSNLIALSFVTVIISTILSIIFAKNMISKDEGKYGINIKYGDNTKYEIYLNSIINIKFIHIISVMCEILKRKRVGKNATKSYRRTYGYNHE